MILARETIATAFWARVSPLSPSPFITASRRLRHWNDVPANEQPAIFMTQNHMPVTQRKGVPPTWRMMFNLFLYDNCQGTSGAIPGQRLNPLIDAIDGAFAPNALGEQTLGGLVSHCWISGPIEVYEGFAGMMDQSVVIFPFEVEIPDAGGPQ